MRTADRIRGANPSSDVPVICRSVGPGPRVVVTAGVHGDELVGLAVCHLLDKRVVIRRGELVLYPAANPAGVVARSRGVPDDQGDLNRAFPGDGAGSATERHAHRLWKDIAGRRPTALLDLHADAPTAIPYALVDRVINRALPATLEGDALALAGASGLPVLLEYPPEQYRRFGLDRSLAGAALNHLGIPSVTLEVGPRRVIDPGSVERLYASVLGILAYLGMVDGPPPPRAGPSRVRGHAPRARCAGLFVPEVPVGESFQRGDVLGRIVGLDGSERDALRAESAGIVVGWAEGGWVEVGGIAGTLGVEDSDG